MKLSNPIFDLPIIMSLYKLTMVGLTLLFLSGCVAIPLPVPEPEPFPEKVTGTIVPGKTSRKDVLATLGNPRSASTDGKLFIYSEEQLTHLGILFLPIGGGWERVGPTHYYIISFARNGTVASTKIVTKISDYCRRDGRCLVMEDDLNFWYAPAAIEASAKKFTPISNKCTIYYMEDGNVAMWFPKSSFKIAIDRRKTLQFPQNNSSLAFRYFYRTVVPAGIHEFSYLKNPATVKVRHRPLSFQCHAGDVVFVSPLVKYSLKGTAGLWSANPENLLLTFTLLDPKKAKRIILRRINRMRMLDPGK